MEADKKLIKDLTPEIEKTSVKWYITFFIFLRFFCSRDIRTYPADRQRAYCYGHAR